MFGVAPGTGDDTNPNAVDGAHAQHRVHQRRAHRRRRRVVGGPHRRDQPAHLTDWRGNDWTPASDTPAAHPNSRFTAPLSQVPSVAPEWEDPAGVPISAILFGGRRATHRAARHRGVRLAPRRVPRLDHGLGDDRRRRRRGRQPAPRPVRDAAVLRLPHGRLLRALARASARRTDAVEAAEAVLRELVPQGRRAASSSGRATARTAACSRGCSTGATTRPTRSTRRSAGSRRSSALPTDGLDVSRPTRSPSCCRSTRTAWRAELPLIEDALRRSSATGLPQALRDELAALDERLG